MKAWVIAALLVLAAISHTPAAVALEEVHPGDFIAIEGTPGCTAGFVFHDGAERYLTTAGHCVLTSGDDEKIWPADDGPAVRSTSGEYLGRVRYAVVDWIFDMALVRLHPSAPVSPQVRFYGGPTRLDTRLSDSPEIVRYYGQGLGLGTIMPAREGVAPRLNHRGQVFFAGVAVLGDSGSPLMSKDGGALGILKSAGAKVAPETGDFGTVFAARFLGQLPRVEAAVGVRLTLETAPLLVP